MLIAPCAAQQHPAITFDISSVKPASEKSSQANIRRLDVGIVSVSSMTLIDMIEMFYSVRPYQIVGGPGWIKQNRYDVMGKDSTNNTAGQKLSDEAWAASIAAGDIQMRHLLEDRFALRMQQESRVVPGLALHFDGKKLPTAVPCASGYRLQRGLVKGAIRITSLTAQLAVESGVPVTDRTGLKGCYDLDLHWTSDPTEESLPSMPTSLREIGLRLQKAKSDIDVFVIDNVRRPQPD